MTSKKNGKKPVGKYNIERHSKNRAYKSGYKLQVNKGRLAFYRFYLY